MLIVIIRTHLVYLVLMLLLRLLGKRQLGEMELSEFVVAALIADLAANALEDPSVPLPLAMLPILTLAALELLIAWLSMRFIRLRLLLFGRPSLIIDRGRLRQEEMRKNRFTADELMQALRSQGILDIGEVLYAVLETNGTLNVIPRENNASDSAARDQTPDGEKAYPRILISDGRVLDQNLRALGFDRNWLRKRLQEQKLAGPEEVFLLCADETGRLFCCRREAP